MLIMSSFREIQWFVFNDDFAGSSMKWASGLEARMMRLYGRAVLSHRGLKMAE